MRISRLAAVVLLTASPALLAAQDAHGGCAPGNAGLTLPRGFCAALVAEDLPGPRHMSFAPGGELFVALRGNRNTGGGVIGLRFGEDGKVVARSERFGDFRSTEVLVRNGYLWAETGTAILRWRLTPGTLAPTGAPDTVVRDLPAGGHATKTFALGRDGTLYVNIGSRSNACQQVDRTAGSRGVDPCVELETRAGIWTFRSDRLGQTQADGQRYATGIRNAVGITLAPDGRLWVAQHGRDQLSANWPALFDSLSSAENPAEELLAVGRNADFGWPYCYYDVRLKRRVLAPEYGGNGRDAGRCATKGLPVATFPAHWAPNAVLFYTGRQLPARYRDGVFVAFHGSWNRAPLPQAGFNVVFQPLRRGRATGKYEVIADGFRTNRVYSDGERASSADARPTGLAVGPDGSLFVSDDNTGRIWRIRWVGR